MSLEGEASVGISVEAMEESSVSSETDGGGKDSRVSENVDEGVSGAKFRGKQGGKGRKNFGAVNVSSEISEEMERRSLKLKDEEMDPVDSDGGFDMQNGEMRNLRHGTEGEGFSFGEKSHTEVGKATVSQYDTLISEFDDYAAGAETSKASRHGFEVGDLVWGKVKSHPWWPGRVFSEAFASTSVRRSRKAGHVLVAFFGDSSYGWFDPAELIPFDANFAEKSKQTSSRTFLKAVEEAVDEVSRRRALGLACLCRNPNNFRHTDVKGYFAVDIFDYEIGGVYSVKQINKARAFHTAETVSFVRDLAVAPHTCDHTSLDCVKQKATVFAYRKAVFEEFDETYAQAFGTQPSGHSHESKDATVKQLPRAPLSGPLVMAEALGSRKSSTKPAKVKDQTKKERYLFKRRDDPNDSTNKITPGKTSISASPAHSEGSGALSLGDYVFQKREPVDLHSSQDKEEGPSQEVEEEGVTLDIASGITSTDNTDFSRKEVAVDSKIVESTTPVEEILGAAQSLDAKEDFGMGANILVKKPGATKRPVELSSSDKSIVGEKKKKRKKEIGTGTNSEHDQKRLVTTKVGALAGKSAGKPIQADLAPREDSNFRTEYQKKDNGVDISSAGLELPQLLSDLHALALDPFHGIERMSPTVILQVFSRYRSLVYQKSLILSQAAENLSPEVPVFTKSSFAENPSTDAVQDSKSSKQQKPVIKSNDPTNLGRKRGLSDRQEEIAVKRMKKINNLKSLAAEKRVSQKTPEGKETVGQAPAPTPPKPVKPADSIKKTGPLVKSEHPMMLVMKFPPDTSLPSGNELRARFTRFGPLDHSGTRVFYKSSTCRVVFRYQADAQAAYKYAISSNSLFGNVRYHLRDLSAPASELPDSGKGREDTPTTELLPPPPSVVQPVVQLKSCLKKPTGEESSRATSRVKFMLGGEESGNGSGIGIGIGIGTGTSSMVDNRKNNNNASFADGSSSTIQFSTATASTTVAMDINSKNYPKLHSQLPPLLPLPTEFQKQTPPNSHYAEVGPRISQNYNVNRPISSAPRAPLPPLPPPSSNVDISQQMLSLLTRCNDVVSNVMTYLGYVPYHPL